MSGGDADPFRAEREYVAVRPTTDALVPESAATALRRLHADDGRTIEMCLVTAGADDGVTYLFGGRDVATDTVERFLDGGLPTAYERTRVPLSLADALTPGAVPDPGGYGDAAADPLRPVRNSSSRSQGLR